MDISEGFLMLQSRRGFLVGIGSLLTTGFVKEARSFIRTNGRPLLAAPAQVAQTLYWYENGEDAYLLTLGEWTDTPPPPPTWRELLVEENVPHKTENDIREVSIDYGIEPEEYDKIVP